MQVTLCDPYQNALEAFANTRYTNLRYVNYFIATSAHQWTLFIL